jgi:multidrug efflux pump subunit AcrB
MQSKEALVALRYLSSEQSPELLENWVLEPVERALVSLGRVSSVTATASHGYVDFQIQFEGGATEQDLASVEKQIEKIVFANQVAITSRTVLLGSVKDKG